MPLTTRPVRLSDSPALARICLLTGDAGASAEHLHSPPYHDILGSVWALPYAHLPHTWGFVLVDPALDTGDRPLDAVKGYILGTSDTRAFERAEEETWWPPLRARFPLEQPPSEPDKRTEADTRYVGIIHRAPDPALPECLALSPAHMHIDLLPEVQRQGWGRVLIGLAVDHLRGLGLDALWLGMDPKNTEAAKFYARLGFEAVKGTPESVRGLRFANWTR